MKTKYDIFISYRRTGFETANLIATKLKGMGYSVFFDVESLRSGKFNEQLFNVIENCKDFVVVLPPDALDRCVDEEDWVRKEVRHGIKCEKNIIPIMLNGFEWPEPMPVGMEQLKDYQAVTATSNEFFDMSIKRLAGFCKSKPNKHKLLKRIEIVICSLVFLVGIFYAVVSVAAKPVANKVGAYLAGNEDMMYGLYADVVKIDEAWDVYCLAYRGANTDEYRKNLTDDFLLQLENISQDVGTIRNNIPKSPDLRGMQGALLMLYMISKEDVECSSALSELTCGEIDSIIVTIRRFAQSNDVDQLNYKYINYMIDEFRCESYGCYYYYMAEMKLLPKSARKEHDQLSKTWLNYPLVSLSMPLTELMELGNKEYDKASKLTENMGLLFEKENNRLDEIERFLDSLDNMISNDIQK